MVKYLLGILLLISIVCSLDVKVNRLPLLNEAPRLISQVPNGQKMLVGSLDDPEKNYLYIANLKGTPAEMGLAYGQLFK